MEPAATGAEPPQRRGLPCSGQVVADCCRGGLQLLQERLPSERDRPSVALHVIAKLVARCHGPGRHARVIAHPLADGEERGGDSQLTEQIEQGHRAGSGLIGAGAGEIVDGEGQDRSVAGTSEDHVHRGAGR